MKKFYSFIVFFLLLAGLTNNALAQPQYYNSATVGSSNSFPFNQVAGKQVQLLYLPGEFSQPTPAPAGTNITSISLLCSAALGPYTYTDFVVKLGQSTITAFAAGDFYTGTLTTVFSRTSVVLSGVAGGWLTITLDTPYGYDPTKSLIVDIQQCGAPGATGFSSSFFTTAENRRNWSVGGCPFAYYGANAVAYNFGITTTPACQLPAAAGTIIGPINVCKPTNGVVYSVGAISGATSYVWSVPTGATIVAGSGTNTITVNFGPTAVSGNISVYGTNICGNGTASTLPVTLNSPPVPVITGPASVCGYSAGNVYSTTAGMTSYTWTVSAGGMITAGGTANSNTATVTWTTPGAQTISVNYANAAGCSAATPTIFPVTVAPGPTMNVVPNQVVCNGSPTTATAFSGAAGLIFNWTNNNPSIGLGASGTGNIASFNAVNSGGTPVTATVSVTPALPGASVQTVTGTLDVGDATIAGGRLYRDGVPSTCATPKAYPGTSGAGPYYYDTYNFTNTTGTSQCVSVTYSSPGSGNAFVTAYNGSFNSANLGTNYIADGGSSSVGPAGATVTFSFNLANGATVVLVVNEAVTSEVCTGYSLSVTGLPTIGCIGLPTTFTYTVNPTPTVNPVANQNVCKNTNTAPITFGSNVAGTTFTWTNSNTAIGLAASGTGNIPSFLATNTGANPISGTIVVTPSSYTNAGVTCNGVPQTFLIIVNNIPVPTVTGSASLCAGATGVTYSTEAGNSNYSWTISYDGIITSGLNTNTITVNWPTAGSRYVAVNYANAGGCIAVAPTYRNVTVLPVPVPMIFGENAVCQGATGVTYSTQAGNSAYVWTVSSGGTITSGAGTASIKVTWNTGGAQTVSVNYTNAGGCSAVQPTVYNVAVGPLPAAGGTITGPATVCTGAQGVAYTVPAIANATTYNWIVPTGVTIASGATTNSITVNFSASAATGIIKVNGVNTCGNGTPSSNFNVTVNPVPATPVITKTGSVLSSSATTGNQWYRNGVLIAGATAQQFTPVYLGTYTVIVTVGGCSSDVSNSIVITAIVATQDFELSHSFDVYPNPSKGQFNIKVVSGKPVELSIEVYNNLGALLWKQEKVQIDGTYITPVDLGKIPAGVYMVALRNANTNLVRKMVIMK